MNTRLREDLHHFEKLANFRDIGGLQTVDGRVMKAGLLYRSDDISKMSQKDTEKLSTYNIKVVCDLRTPKRHRSKRLRHASNESFHLFNFPLHQDETQASRRMILDFFFRRSGGERFLEFSSGYYQHMAFKSTSQIKALITLLAQEENLPALIHCTAGKDRTGYIAALIQLFAGVPYETVLQEYLLTNHYYETRLETVAKIVNGVTLKRVSPARTKLILTAHQRFLDEVYQTMLKKYGSVAVYLREGCGIEESTLAKFKESLLEAQQ
ncbi:tyrosine-protein phosphatase [Brevibacillus sp. AY1]|uniref:tyrosine-protein phosphatase n=1 Tax=Brevibacillus sp. AY1 TaxID=2807621 RepID=UPI0024548015|nr:tyrosine-protein phosphatase [Brevibacillus sp. AY1]MDH4618984.1 tyrosine-protein phosphatase [Brevibacillus sp. AY1]